MLDNCVCCRQGQSAAADKLRQHTKDVSGSDAQGVPACSSVSERMHDDGTGLEDRVVGQCAALHQIGYAWQRAAPHQCSANIWPVSSHALPGVDTTHPHQCYIQQRVKRFAHKMQPVDSTGMNHNLSLCHMRRDELVA